MTQIQGGKGPPGFFLGCGTGRASAEILEFQKIYLFEYGIYKAVLIKGNAFVFPSVVLFDTRREKTSYQITLLIT